jgi:hypothetical protein
MAQRTAAYLKNGADSFNFDQTDRFYLPARFQKAYIDIAHQMRAQYVISEVALPNILGLLRDQPAEIEPLSLAMPWGYEHNCVSDRYTAVMPLRSNLNASVARECVRGYRPEQQSDKHGLFAVHALKLSNATIAQHWLDWWMSQSC